MQLSRKFRLVSIWKNSSETRMDSLTLGAYTLWSSSRAGMNALVVSVSSAVVQRYLSHIHEASLSLQPQIQSAAVDILSFTIKQGLAHPLQVRPYELSRLLRLSNLRDISHFLLLSLLKRVPTLHSVRGRMHFMPCSIISIRHF